MYTHIYITAFYISRSLLFLILGFTMIFTFTKFFKIVEDFIIVYYRDTKHSYAGSTSRVIKIKCADL